jgi:hypothetical protein
MDASILLRKWIQNTQNQFPGIGFKYKNDVKYKTHYIAVYPYDKISEDENYCREEVEFYFFMEKTFPKETFLFGSEIRNFTPSALKDAEIFKPMEKIPIRNNQVEVKYY